MRENHGKKEQLGLNKLSQKKADRQPELAVPGRADTGVQAMSIIQKAEEDWGDKLNNDSLELVRENLVIRKVVANINGVPTEIGQIAGKYGHAEGQKEAVFYVREIKIDGKFGREFIENILSTLNVPGLPGHNEMVRYDTNHWGSLNKIGHRGRELDLHLQYKGKQLPFFRSDSSGALENDFVMKHQRLYNRPQDQIDFGVIVYKKRFADDHPAYAPDYDWPKDELSPYHEPLVVRSIDNKGYHQLVETAVQTEQQDIQALSKYSTASALIRKTMDEIYDATDVSTLSGIFVFESSRDRKVRKIEKKLIKLKDALLAMKTQPAKKIDAQEVDFMMKEIENGKYLAQKLPENLARLAEATDAHEKSVNCTNLFEYLKFLENTVEKYNLDSAIKAVDEAIEVLQNAPAAYDHSDDEWKNINAGMSRAVGKVLERKIFTIPEFYSPPKK